LRELDEARHDVEREMAKRILHHMQPVRVHLVKDALFGQVISGIHMLVRCHKPGEQRTACRGEVTLELPSAHALQKKKKISD